MKKFKILGYTNPITLNCVPLITIIKIDNKIGALFPDCTIKKINISNSDKLNKLDNYIVESNDKYISQDEYSYMTFDKEIKVGNPKYLIKEMKIDLKKLPDKSIHKELLEDLISSEIIKLDYQIYNIIPNHAKKILSNSNIKIPIDFEDLYEICFQNNINISINNNMDYDGRIYQKDNNIYLEYKNVKNSIKENFTIAHELGHYFLHFKQQNYFNDVKNNFSNKHFSKYAARLDGEARGSKKEAEASFFAAELLMPDEEIIKYICKKNWDQYQPLTPLTKEMSQYFNVSRNSLILKLRRMQFLEKKDPEQVSETSNLKVNQRTLRIFRNKYI